MVEIQLLEGVTQVPRGEWNALVGDEPPFLEWDWLVALEEAGAVGGDTGWLPRPLLLREGGGLVAAAPLYVKAHSEGEFVFDWGWAEAAERAGLRYYPKLVVGVPFTPVAGARVLTAPGADRARLVALAGEALASLCGADRLSGVHVNFCREDECAGLEAAGFLPRLGFQYHWHNAGYRDFEDFLDGLRGKRRNQVRRERRELERQGVRIEVLAGEAIVPSLAPTLYRIYLATVDRNPWGRRYLNRRVFELWVERLRHRMCCIVARRGSEIVAGTVNFQKGSAFYGRYWGAFQELRHLHFNVCYYAGIEHCIREGLQRFEPGAGGDYKQLRGFDAQATWSVHHLADGRLAAAVARFLDAERRQAERAIGWLHEHSALRGEKA